MRMTKEQLARVAKNFLETLERESIDSPEAAKKRIGEVFDPDGGGEEYVDVDAHPRNPAATVISYKRRIGQTPIMLICAPGYVKAMITAEKPVPGFDVFDEEPEYGLMQDRKFADFASALAALKGLTA